MSPTGALIRQALPIHISRDSPDRSYCTEGELIDPHAEAFEARVSQLSGLELL